MVQGRLKISEGYEHPKSLLFTPMGIVLLQMVNITIECVGVTVEVHAQKVY